MSEERVASTPLDPGGVVAIVLAAGASRRMGAARNKLLEPVAGRPLIAWPITAMLEAGVSRIAIVVGHEADRVRAALARFGPAVEFVDCPDWEAGMGHSIAAGLRFWTGASSPAPEWGALFVSVGDLPGLRADVVRDLLAARDAETPPEARRGGIWMPTADGRRGHPVLFDRDHAETLAALEGDVGARGLLASAGSAIREVEVGTPAIFRDVDTPEGLDQARQDAADDASDPD